MEKNSESLTANSEQTRSRSSKETNSIIMIPGDSTEEEFQRNDTSELELPVGQSLSHELFCDSEFDPDEFLLSRRHTALEDLRIELRNYLTELKSELVGLINEDYEDFIGLGMGLRGTVERAIRKIKSPISQAKQDILDARNQLNVQHDDLEGLLKERRQVIEAKKLVRLMLDCGDTVTKVEEMLLIHSSNSNLISNPKIDHFTSTHRRSVSKLGSSSKSIELHLELDDDINHIESGVKRLERITNEYSKMLYLVSKGFDLAYVIGLQPRIDKITKALQTQLGSLLKSILRLPRSNHRKKEFLTESLRAYETLGIINLAEVIIKIEVVLPKMSKLIHADALNTGALSPLLPASPEVARFKTSHSPRNLVGNISSGHPTCNLLPFPEEPELIPLPLLYNKILAFIAREMSSTLEVADRLLAGSKLSTELSNQDDLSSSNEPTPASSTQPTVYNVLVNSVIVPILQLITNTLGSNLFAAGNPTTFHRNYSYTTKFLDQLEQLCVSPRQVLSLRGHPDWNAFKNKWQLAVYAQIRTKEMILLIEEGLRDGIKPPHTSDPTISIHLPDSSSSSTLEINSFSTETPDYSMRGSLVLDLAVHSIWQDDVFLTDLTHRFWRLTLMAISRYATWLNSVIASYNLSCAETPSTTGGLNENKTGKTTTDMNRSTSTNRPNPSSLHDHLNPKVASDESKDDELLKICTIVVSDLCHFNLRISDLFRSSINPRIPQVLVGSESQTPEDILKISMEKMMRFVEPLTGEIKGTLVKRCSEKLRFIRSVGSSARASKTLPTQPSYFIADILNDIKIYLEKYGKKLTNNQRIRTQLISDIIDDLSAKYLAILINVQRSEDSLRKLKKGKLGFSIFNNQQQQQQQNNNNNSIPGNPALLPHEDEDLKVKLQLKLDVDRLELDAINLGADLSICKSFIELKQNVSKS